MRLNIAGGEDTRARRKTWRAEHRTNGQGLPLAENGFPGMSSSAGSGGGQPGSGVPRTDTSKLNVSWVALSDNENNGFHYHQGFFYEY